MMLRICLIITIFLSSLACTTHWKSIKRSGENKIANLPVISLTVDQAASQEQVVRFAFRELTNHIEDQAGFRGRIVIDDPGRVRGNIRLAVNPERVCHGKPECKSESFRIIAGSNGSIEIVGSDAVGMLWGVRDFQHYYCDEWLKSLSDGRSLTMDKRSSPSIQNRGLWTRRLACFDPYAYIDRASEWKLNTICFWNEDVPMDADLINAYAHERGVRIWWGFGWGVTAGDFVQANTNLARRLQDLYEMQKVKYGSDLKSLNMLAPETASALKDYVLDVFENNYAWIPEIDGIFFQLNPDLIDTRLGHDDPLKTTLFKKNIRPIIETLHRRYPELLITCGVTGADDANVNTILQKIPSYCNILLEPSVAEAPSINLSQGSMKNRDDRGNWLGLYRMTENSSINYRNQHIQYEKPRVWPARVEAMWKYLEEGKVGALDDACVETNRITIDGKYVGSLWRSDWRPTENGSLLDNEHIDQLWTWSKEWAHGSQVSNGIFLKVEAGLIELKMRRVPAMAAELIWDPLKDPSELERRCQLIWERKVGGWAEPLLPFWHESDMIESKNQLPLVEAQDPMAFIKMNAEQGGAESSIKNLK